MRLAQCPLAMVAAAGPRSIALAHSFAIPIATEMGMATGTATAAAATQKLETERWENNENNCPHNPGQQFSLSWVVNVLLVVCEGRKFS